MFFPLFDPTSIHKWEDLNWFLPGNLRRLIFCFPRVAYITLGLTKRLGKVETPCASYRRPPVLGFSVQSVGAHAFATHFIFFSLLLHFYFDTFKIKLCILIVRSNSDPIHIMLKFYISDQIFSTRFWLDFSDRILSRFTSSWNLTILIKIPPLNSDQFVFGLRC